MDQASQEADLAAKHCRAVAAERERGENADTRAKEPAEKPPAVTSSTPL